MKKSVTRFTEPRGPQVPFIYPDWLRPAESELIAEAMALPGVAEDPPAFFYEDGDGLYVALASGALLKRNPFGDWHCIGHKPMLMHARWGHPFGHVITAEDMQRAREATALLEKAGYLPTTDNIRLAEEFLAKLAQ